MPFFPHALNIMVNDGIFLDVGGNVYNQAPEMQKPPDKPSEELIKWISTISFNEEHNQALDQCTPGTGTWILHSPEFNQ
ncbi:hypothetical protein L208DRAFT_1407094 [Tricholoma matsutake]|nr:hypothetical protein L208DRAFT_1407094 [Tricholoma matsutake 945]